MVHNPQSEKYGIPIKKLAYFLPDLNTALTCARLYFDCNENHRVLRDSLNFLFIPDQMQCQATSRHYMHQCINVALPEVRYFNSLFDWYQTRSTRRDTA